MVGLKKNNIGVMGKIKMFQYAVFTAIPLGKNRGMCKVAFLTLSIIAQRCTNVKCFCGFTL
jgi:hypothetical protein